MIDLSNKFDKDFESLKDTQDYINDSSINIIFNQTINDDEDSKNEVENINIENVSNDHITDTEENSSEVITDSEVVNCLALTVKKDYSLSVVKNVVVRTFKGIWKVAISIFTLNIIKFFF